MSAVSLWPHSSPDSSVHGIHQARILKWVAFRPPGDLPNPGIKPTSLASPALAGELFTTSATGEAPKRLLNGIITSPLPSFDLLRISPARSPGFLHQDNHGTYQFTSACSDLDIILSKGSGIFFLKGSWKRQCETQESIMIDSWP